MKALTYIILFFGLISCGSAEKSEEKTEAKETPVPVNYSVQDYMLQEMADLNDYNAMGDPKHPLLSKRQLFDIKINSEDRVLAREKVLYNLDNFNNLIQEFYLENVYLTESEMRIARKNPNSRENAFPFYSVAVGKHMAAIIQLYEEFEVESAIEQKFLKKRIDIQKDALEVVMTYPDVRFKFIENNIMVRIFPLEGASETRVNEIRTIIIKALSEIRDYYAKDLFGLPYSEIYTKYESSGRKEYIMEMKALSALVPMAVADIPNISREVEEHLNEIQRQYEKEKPLPPPMAVPPPPTEVIIMENVEEESRM